MDPIILLNQTKFSKTNWWRLKNDIPGYQDESGLNIVTEISKNRLFKLVETNLSQKNFDAKTRLLVQLFEDGYICWIDIAKLQVEKSLEPYYKNMICDESFIQSKMESILDWIASRSRNSNIYRWGGTVGPNFDCSGLIQTAFLNHQIFLPRDSYQMKNFCRHLFNFPGNIDKLQIGDLLFFGNKYKCRSQNPNICFILNTQHGSGLKSMPNT